MSARDGRVSSSMNLGTVAAAAAVTGNSSLMIAGKHSVVGPGKIVDS